MDSTSTVVFDAANNSSSTSSPQPQKPLNIVVYANPISYAFQSVYVIIGAVGITGNLLALIVFLGHKPLLRRPANYYLVSQSAINLVVSLLLILTVTVDASSWPASVVVPMCYLWNSRSVFIGLYLSSLWNITLMTVDRYLEIVNPIKHHLKISKTKIIASIVVGTLVAIVFKLVVGCQTVKVVNGICTSSSVKTPIKRVVGVLDFLVEYLIPILVIAFCYVSMARSLRRNLRVTHPATSVGPQSTETKFPRARRNIIKTLFIVVLGFIICTSFKEFILMANYLGDVPLNLSGIIFNVAQALENLNCCNDPFIYAFTYEEFRIGLRKLFCRVKAALAGSRTTTTT